MKSDSPQKDELIKSLRSELVISQKEVEQLRMLYTNSPTTKGTSLQLASDALFRLLSSSINNMGSSDTRDAIIAAYSNNNLTITITQLSDLLGMTIINSSDILIVIQSLGTKIIINSDDAMKSIISKMGSSDSREAVIILSKCKYEK